MALRHTGFILSLVTVLTLVSSFAAAERLSCAAHLQSSALQKFFGEMREVSRTETTATIEARDFFQQFKKIENELKRKPTKTLMNIFERLVAYEQKLHGGLTGVRSYTGAARGLIDDLATGKVFSAQEVEKDFEGMPADFIERMKETIRKSPPRSNGYWANYYRNELMSLQTANIYPTFFAKNIEHSLEHAGSVEMDLTSDAMSTTTDFRIYTVLVQRRLLQRLHQNPRKVFTELEIPYPEDDTLLKSSIAVLAKLI